MQQRIITTENVQMQQNAGNSTMQQVIEQKQSVIAQSHGKYTVKLLLFFFKYVYC